MLYVLPATTPGPIRFHMCQANARPKISALDGGGGLFGDTCNTAPGGCGFFLGRLLLPKGLPRVGFTLFSSRSEVFSSVCVSRRRRYVYIAWCSKWVCGVYEGNDHVTVCGVVSE